MSGSKKNSSRKNNNLYYSPNKNINKEIKTVMGQYDLETQQKIYGIISKNQEISDNLTNYFLNNTIFSPLKEEKIKTVNLHETKKIDLLINEIEKSIENLKINKIETAFEKISSNKEIDKFLNEWEKYEKEENFNKNDIFQMSLKKIELTDESKIINSNLSLKTSSKKINVAIDGPSGVGKTTLSKTLASKLNYMFIATGKMYRAYAYNILQNKIELENNKDFEEQVINLWSENMIEYFSENEILLNNKNVSSFLNDDKIASLTSKIAKIEKVREFLVKYQQSLATQKGVIMEGRDITFKVLPDAELKLFLTADSKVRAKRRFSELKLKNTNLDFNEVLLELEKRDKNDSNRKIDPLHKTKDAIEINTTDKTFNEVVDEIYNLVKQKEKEIINE